MSRDDSSSARQALLLRLLSAVYLVAFLVAFHQNIGLIGIHGLLPVPNFLNQVAAHFQCDRRIFVENPVSLVASWIAWPRDDFEGQVAAGCWAAFRSAPSLLWFVPSTSIDKTLDGIALLGLTLSAAVAVTGQANMLMMLALWASYFSIVSAGQSFYSFGWESQLLETGFIGVLACRGVLSLRSFGQLPTPVVIAYRWLLFRVMFGAGMIKLRGDSCWRDLSCMQYFYETQPNPNPWSAMFHHSGPLFHTMEVWMNHFVELVAPFFIFLPQPAAAIGGVIQIGFMAVIICCGNLSFLNWLTMVPAVACFSELQLTRVAGLLFCRPSSETMRRPRLRGVRVLRYFLSPRSLLLAAYLLMVASFSVPVVENLMEIGSQRGKSQVMNGSFDWLRLVNTYGNFGSVTRARNEVQIEVRVRGSRENYPQWQAVGFACKPYDVHQRPCWVSPYHYRLDWQMWFAAFQRIEQNPWLVHLAYKILDVYDDDAHRDDGRTLQILGVKTPQLPRRKAGEVVELRMRLVPFRMNFKPVKQTAIETFSSLYSGNRTLVTPYWSTPYDSTHRKQHVKSSEATAAYLQPVTLQDLKPFVQHVFP